MEDRRRRLPDERASITHKFTVHSPEMGDVDCYVTVGLYPDGTPGEVFIKIAKEGSTLGVLMDQVAVAISIGLQSGVPLATFTTKFKHVGFEPAGWTSGEMIQSAKSPLDYVARWLEARFANVGAEIEDA